MLQKPGICAGQMGHRAGLQSLVLYLLRSTLLLRLEALKQQPGDLSGITLPLSTCFAA